MVVVSMEESPKDLIFNWNQTGPTPIVDNGSYEESKRDDVQGLADK